MTKKLLEGGFFSPAEFIPQMKGLDHSTQCGKCGLYKRCQSPKMKYSGDGLKKILVVGEAPGAEEDEQGTQFVGKAGKRLQRELKRNKINFRRDCWVTNAVRCRPPENKCTDSMIKYCRPALWKEINQLKPNHILLFGKRATEGVLSHLWGDEALTTWLGWVIPCREPNSWISTHYHPSYLERQQDGLLDLLFRRGLKQALKKIKCPPWKKPGDFSNSINVIYREREAVAWIEEFHKRENMFAFDYETNCTKPEYKGAKIVSCSMSDGIITVAFPWTDKVAEKVSLCLKTNIPKIASNMKFEERWTRHFLGHRVRHWDWDTMLAAHMLNHNHGITGLKFQAFVRLGVLPYDRQIEPLLKSQSKSNPINRIDQIPIKDLLVYNGMDSLLEYLIADAQKLETDDGHTATKKRL